MARYSVSSRGLLGTTDEGFSVFDFSTSGYTILDFESYGEGCTKLVVLLDLHPQSV